MRSAPDPGQIWRLVEALIMAFAITAVLTAIALLLRNLFPRGAFSAQELFGPAILFLLVFGFWYLTCVRQTPKMKEFERLARLGSRISRKP